MRCSAPATRVKFRAGDAGRVLPHPARRRTQRLRSRQHGDRGVIPVLKVIAPGFHTTIQDEGRRGFQHVGVPVSGALDRNGYHAGQRTGRKRARAPPAWKSSAPAPNSKSSARRCASRWSAAAAALRSADATAALVPSGQTTRLTKGDIVRVRLGGDAFCSYLAIEAASTCRCASTADRPIPARPSAVLRDGRSAAAMCLHGLCR